MQIQKRDAMNINFKLSVAFALALLFGVNAFGQEWEYSIPYYMADPEMTRQYCAYELSDGRIIISAQLLYNDGSYPYFYPPHNQYPYWTLALLLEALKLHKDLLQMNKLLIHLDSL